MHSQFLQRSAIHGQRGSGDTQTLRRMTRLCHDAVSRFSLDLADVRVLTEAATGPYAATAVIAAIAGAEVVAVSQDSRWGTAQTALEQVQALADSCGVGTKIHFKTGNDAAQIGAEGCHLVTNLGFVRPIDARIAARLAANAVVSLMWEPWEFRPGDIDLNALSQHAVAIIGTNERHEFVRTFDYLGPTAGRLLLECGIELVGSTLVVLGSDPFGAATVGWLEGAGARVLNSNTAAIANSDNLDAVILVEHRHDDEQLSRADLANLGHLGAPVIRICGKIDHNAAREAQVSVVPDVETPTGVMAVTTAYAGLKPVIDLHCAGLRAGADVVLARRAGASMEEALLRSASGFGAALPAGSE